LKERARAPWRKNSRKGDNVKKDSQKKAKCAKWEGIQERNLMFGEKNWLCHPGEGNRSKTG